MPSKEEVGQRLKLARFRRDMTLKEVAQRSGMSATHISEIERGKTSPTIGALQKIANALDERPAHFVEEHEIADVCLIRRGDRIKDYSCDGSGGATATERVCGGAPWSSVHIARKLAEPGESISRPPMTGELVVVCVEGMVRVTIGDESHVLRDGDTIQFPLDSGYLAETLGDEKSEAYLIAATRERRSW